MLNAFGLDLALREDQADSDDSDDPGPTEESGRDLQKITANGEAVMESRTWETAARTGEPQLFRITGDHVEYEPLTREALVKGEGGLLVHDPHEQVCRWNR